MGCGRSAHNPRIVDTGVLVAAVRYAESAQSHPDQTCRPQLQALRRGRDRARQSGGLHRTEQLREDLGDAGAGPVGHRSQALEREALGEEHAGETAGRDGQPPGSRGDPDPGREPAVARDARAGRAEDRRSPDHEQRPHRSRRRGSHEGQALDVRTRVRLRERGVLLLPAAPSRRGQGPGSHAGSRRSGRHADCLSAADVGVGRRGDAARSGCRERADRRGANRRGAPQSLLPHSRAGARTMAGVGRSGSEPVRVRDQTAPVRGRARRDCDDLPGAAGHARSVLVRTGPAANPAPAGLHVCEPRRHPAAR